MSKIAMSKRALITGASSGIGLATSNALHKESYAVTGVARDFTKRDDYRFNTVELDLAKIDALPGELSSLDGLKAEFDVMVLNAGYGRFGGLEQFSHQQIRHLVDTNLVSNLYLLKHFLPIMRRNGGGDIVLMGSESAVSGGKMGAVYCATKFALRGLAQSLRADCASSNIRVMLLNPGPVNSDFFDDLNFEPQSGTEFSIQPEEVAQAIVNALKMPRNVVSEEINIQPMKRSFSKKN